MSTSAPAKTHGVRDVLGALGQPRVAAMLALGFSSGLPFLLTGATFGFWLADAGATLTEDQPAGIAQTLELFLGLNASDGGAGVQRTLHLAGTTTPHPATQAFLETIQPMAKSAAELKCRFALKSMPDGYGWGKSRPANPAERTPCYRLGLEPSG